MKGDTFKCEEIGIKTMFPMMFVWSYNIFRQYDFIKKEFTVEQWIFTHSYSVCNYIYL